MGKKSGLSHCILGYGSAHSMLWLCTAHFKNIQYITIVYKYNIPECSEPHEKYVSIANTCSDISSSSLILRRNLSKKYQPKKKEEDENKYV